MRQQLMQYLMHMQTPQYQDSISKQIDREKVSLYKKKLMQYLMHMQTPQYQDSISKQIDRDGWV